MERIAYITFREPDEEGILRYFILQKEFPHNLGCISTLPNPEALVQATVPGYNLWIVHAGVLRGNFVAIYPSHKEELQLVYDNMANWYYEERILKDWKKYEKYKIKNNNICG